MARRKRPNILVSWVSLQHHAAPLLTVLSHRESELRGRVDRVVLCHRQARGEDDEHEALQKTLAQLDEALPADARPQVEVRTWRTNARPTDHAAVLDFAKKVLRSLRDEHPDAALVLHLSPGTKAMHAAWLILAHGAFVPGPIRLLQTSEERHRRGQAPIEWVKLPTETWAHIVQSSAPTVSGEATDHALWEPARVESAAARRVLELVDRWAPMPAPILLIGERGTGKTTLAHTIRARSPFRTLDDKGWPVVVCGQFRANPQLARSELFGHKRGAFTGADADREGILERVNGDTLFLDEIADLDHGTQRLLIAAVEGRDFQRLGEPDRNRQAKFRLIAATNQPLSRLVMEQRDPPSNGADASPRVGIDADFYDRISTFILRIPPLRERREDLPLLWRSALTRAATSATGISPETLVAVARDKALSAALAEHPLPGNVRDLQRAAWWAIAALGAGASITVATREAIAALDPVDADDLPEATGTTPRQTALPIDLDAHLADEERAILDLALEAARGNKAKAAQLVGLPRKTFEYRLGRSGR